MKRALLPIAVFIAVLGLHFAWSGLFPEVDAAQARWATVETSASWLERYTASQGYWLGYSYGLALAFAAVQIRRFRERRIEAARNAAIGSVTFSGIFAVAGCFLLGCCGSPMLPIYLSLFGTAFLPLVKPIAAGVTTVMIVGIALWSRRAPARAAAGACVGCDCSREQAAPLEIGGLPQGASMDGR